MKLSWKLLPVAALFALGVALVSFPAGIVSAHTISVPATMALNTPTTITVSIDATASQTVTLSAVGSVTNAGLFVGAPSVSTGETVSGSGTSNIFFTENATNVARTLTASFQCTQPATITFSLFVNGVPQAVSGSPTTTCGGGTGTTSATIQAVTTLVSQGGQSSYTATATTSIQNQSITISASPAYVTFGQPNIVLSGFVTQDTVVGQNSTSLTIYPSQVGTRTISGTFTCIQQGSFTLTIVVSGGTTAYSQSIICGTGLTPTVGVASNVTVAASPTTVSCNGTAFVTVTVRNAAGGYVADGTSVSLTASMGSLSPTTATTLGGGVLAVFTGPGNQSGTATIQASAAGVATGSATIQVNCTTATATPAIPPTIFVPPASGTGVITPPSTGDAGLAEDNAWQTYGGVTLIVASVLGAAAIVRKRA